MQRLAFPHITVAKPEEEDNENFQSPLNENIFEDRDSDAANVRRGSDLYNTELNLVAHRTAQEV